MNMTNPQIRQRLAAEVKRRRVSFPELTRLSDANARLLAQRQGALLLNSVVTLTKSQARAFADHKGALELKGLQRLSVAAARELAKRGARRRGKVQPIELNWKVISGMAVSELYNCLRPEVPTCSIKALTPALAMYLQCKPEGAIILSGLETLDAATAKILAKRNVRVTFPARLLKRNLLVIFGNTTLDVVGLPHLSDSRPHMQLAGRISRFSGSITLLDLASVSPKAGRLLLSRVKKRLELPSLKNASPEVVAKLLRARNPDLVLTAELTTLLDAAAARMTLPAPSSMSPRFSRKNGYGAIFRTLSSTDYRWTMFKKRFASSPKRLAWYPCCALSYHDVLPLAVGSKSPDLVIFVDSNFSAREEQSPFSGYGMIFNLVPLKIDATHCVTGREDFLTPTAQFFEMKYYERGTHQERKLDCLFFTCEWWALFAGFILHHRVPVNDLVLDYLQEIALLTTRAKELGLERVLSKLGPLPTVVEQAWKQAWDPRNSRGSSLRATPTASAFISAGFGHREELLFGETSVGEEQDYRNLEIWERHLRHYGTAHHAVR